MQMLLSPEYQLLISLVKSEIWPEENPGKDNCILDTSLICKQITDLQAEGWAILFEQAARQGLLAIVWDALDKLNAGPGYTEMTTRLSVAEHQEMTKLRIRWALNIKKIEDVHDRQWMVLKELAGIFAESGMRVMVLKGLGLAQMYPRPEHRECGDLDIYLSGNSDNFARGNGFARENGFARGNGFRKDARIWNGPGFEKRTSFGKGSSFGKEAAFGMEDCFELGNKVIRSMRIPFEYDGSKHSKFYYKGIPVENHKNFLNVTYTQVDKNLECELVRILQEQKCESLELGGVSADIPPPDFQMIFLIRHAITHFLSSGIVLRHLYDLGIFYTAHAHEIDLERIEKILMRESQYKLYRAFMDVLHIFLGMPEILQERQQTAEDARLAERVLADIIAHPAGGKGKVKVENMWVPMRKIVGAVRLYKFRWKYKLVEKNAFGNRFWGAIGNCFR